MERKKTKQIIINIATIVIIVILSVTILLNEKSKSKIVYKEKIIYKDNSIRTKKEITKYENIVFLGDSITELYPIQKIFGNLPIVKSGKAGYTTQDLLDRMESMVYQYNPTSVYILIGTNDIMYDGEEKKEKAIDNIKKIIKNIQKNRKKAKIYIESIYPVNKNMEAEMVRDRDNNVIKEINESLKNYCKENKITYINMYDELTDSNGDFDSKYTFDGLHPSELGYAKITQVRLPYIYGIEK